VNVATLAELQTRREALAASRASGVARVSYDGKTVEYRSLAESTAPSMCWTARLPRSRVAG